MSSGLLLGWSISMPSTIPSLTSSRSRGILLYTVGWANTTTAPAALAVASTSRTGMYSGEWSTLPRGFQPNSSW